MAARRSFLLKSLLALLLLAGRRVSVTRSSGLPAFGRALVHDDGPANADIAVVLAGDSSGHRMTKAAELVQAGLRAARSWSAARPAFTASTRRRWRFRSPSDKGYPAEWFIPLRHTALSTREEAVVVLDDLQAARHPQLPAGHEQLSHRPGAPHLPQRGAPVGRRPGYARGRRARRVLHRRTTGGAIAKARRPSSWSGPRPSPRRSGSSACGNRCTPFASTCGATAAAWRWAACCLVLKDLAQAAAAADDPRRGGLLPQRRRPSCASAGYLVGLALLKGIFQYWMRVILIGISRDIEYDLRNDLFAPPGPPLARLLRAAPAPATSWRAPPTT